MALVLLGVLIIFLLLEYRQYQSYQTPIHQRANIILKLNIDGLAWEYAKELDWLLDKDTSSIEKATPPPTVDMGIKIGANIFVYTVSTKLYNSFFCTLPLTDSASFKNYITPKWNISFTDKGGFAVGKTANERLTVYCTEKYAAIAYSPHKEEVADILIDLVTRKNLLKPADVLMKKLKNDKHHFSIVSNTVALNGNLSQDKLLITGNGDWFSRFQVPEKPIRRTYNDTCYGYFYLNGRPVELPNKTYQVKQVNVNADSALSYYNNYFDVSLNGTGSQKDTITTYEYNDNFEKKEVQTISESAVPDFGVVITTKSDGLLNYLKQQGVSTADEKLNQEIFPLYAVSITEEDGRLCIYPDGSRIRKEEFIASPEFFGLYANIPKIRTIPDLAYAAKYIQSIRSISLKGKLDERRYTKIEGAIVFEKKALKAIMELPERD